MKKNLLCLCLVFLSFLGFAQKKNAVKFTSVDLNGNSVSEKIFASNKITMLNVWGTFCPPCIREMPELSSLDRNNKEKGVAVIGIPVDITDGTGKLIPELKADAEKIIKTTGADYVHIVPSREMFSGFLRNVQAVPATFFIDSNGNIVGKMYLGARSEKDWQKIIDKILEGQK